MNCPSCNRSFSFLDSFRILNPFRYKCPTCASLLTTGSKGWITIVYGGFLGFLLAAVAIVMEEAQRWTSLEKFIWFAVSIPLACVSYQWFWWRRTNLILRR